jgi:hypothetical protein
MYQFRKFPAAGGLMSYCASLPDLYRQTGILALTKMNWNSTQFDLASPIPIRAARQVGRVFKYVPFGQVEQPDYRYYS